MNTQRKLLLLAALAYTLSVSAQQCILGSQSEEACTIIAGCAWNDGLCLQCSRTPVENCTTMPNCQLSDDQTACIPNCSAGDPPVNVCLVIPGCGALSNTWKCTDCAAVSGVPDACPTVHGCADTGADLCGSCRSITNVTLCGESEGCYLQSGVCSACGAFTDASVCTAKMTGGKCQWDATENGCVAVPFVPCSSPSAPRCIAEAGCGFDTACHECTSQNVPDGSCGNAINCYVTGNACASCDTITLEGTCTDQTEGKCEWDERHGVCKAVFVPCSVATPDLCFAEEGCGYAEDGCRQCGRLPMHNGSCQETTGCYIKTDGAAQYCSACNALTSVYLCTGAATQNSCQWDISVGTCNASDGALPSASSDGAKDAVAALFLAVVTIATAIMAL